MSILITLEKHLINQLGRDVTNHINNYIQYNDRKAHKKVFSNVLYQLIITLEDICDKMMFSIYYLAIMDNIKYSVIKKVKRHPNIHKTELEAFFIQRWMYYVKEYDIDKRLNYGMLNMPTICFDEQGYYFA
jgi:hypothetical protein